MDYNSYFKLKKSQKWILTLKYFYNKIIKNSTKDSNTNIENKTDMTFNTS